MSCDHAFLKIVYFSCFFQFNYSPRCENYNVNDRFLIRYSFHLLHVPQDNFFLKAVLDDLRFLLGKPNLLLILLFLFLFVSSQLQIPQIFVNKLNEFTDFFQLPSAFNLGDFGRGRRFVNFINF